MASEESLINAGGQIMLVKSLALAFGLVLGASLPAFAAPKPIDGVLSHFIGKWSITGTTRGKPAVTGADVQPEFDGNFLDLHIKDPAGRDGYEARVYFGSDASGSLVVHWLDATGGETSRTLGGGQVQGDVVTLTFPYPDGVFRDRLTYDRTQDSWRLFIEMGPADHPKVFSDWYFKRRD
jgi:hypothetical protein